MYLKYMEKYDYEQIVIFQDKETGLKGVTVIHNTKLGPALGGARLWNYETEDEAIFDCLRLARGMTLKSASAGLKLGGGKTVLIGDNHSIKNRKQYFNKLGEYIEKLNGNYITAEDMNTTTVDMSYINEKTNHVTGLEGKSGDPSPVTALGAFYAVKASLKHLYDNDDIRNYTYAILGVGATGKELLRHLTESNAKNIYYSDINEENIKFIKENFPNAILVSNEELMSLDVDVFIPCARGGILNSETIPNIKAKIICGTANNVLLDEVSDSLLIKEHNILYAPDFIVNAGGIINVYHEINGYNYDNVKKDLEMIYGRLLEIFTLSEKNKISTHEAALKYANKVLEEGLE